MSAHLKSRGFYIIGDSAYALRSFLITPYDNAAHGTDEDNFNFFRSSSRIVVECAFGEVDSRWGIFWRPYLKFNLDASVQIIEAALRLHTFIVDFSIEHGIRDAPERSIFDEDCNDFLASHPYAVVGTFADSTNDEARGRGRPSNDEREQRQQGIEVRDNLRNRINNERLVRPSRNWYRDRFNHTRLSEE